MANPELGPDIECCPSLVFRYLSGGQSFITCDCPPLLTTGTGTDWTSSTGSYLLHQMPRDGWDRIPSTSFYTKTSVGRSGPAYIPLNQVLLWKALLHCALTE